MHGHLGLLILRSLLPATVKANLPGDEWVGVEGEPGTDSPNPPFTENKTSAPSKLRMFLTRKYSPFPDI